MATTDVKTDSSVMSDYQFSRWTALLEQRTGIHLPEQRRSFLVSSLNIRMRELAMDSYDAYYHYLTDGRRGAVEWEILVDRLTVHETRFYRDSRALEMVKQQCLSRYLAAEAPAKLNVWSVGCATGEEAYSLAILVDDFFKSAGVETYFGITATDVSAASLATARKGVYPLSRLSNLPDGLLANYFHKVDDKYYQVLPVLTRRVCFMRQNLLHLNNARVGQMDLIYCQNVLIYFQRERRIEILNDLVAHLKPGGILILGAGEILDWHNNEIESIGQQGILAYRRISQQDGAAA